MAQSQKPNMENEKDSLPLFFYNQNLSSLAADPQQHHHHCPSDLFLDPQTNASICFQDFPGGLNRATSLRGLCVLGRVWQHEHSTEHQLLNWWDSPGWGQEALLCLGWEQRNSSSQLEAAGARSSPLWAEFDRREAGVAHTSPTAVL